MNNNFFTKICALTVTAALLFSMPLSAYADGEIELEDLKPIKEAVCETMGEDTIVGAAVTLDELRRNAIQALVEKHFNAVTFGNELKPDALFGYSNGKCPGTYETELNGQTITVPKMDFSRAEEMCNIIYKWNEAHPDDYIKVRGHVLVWHSQTPEWFFHVDYDKTKDYVTPDEMSIRLEWYIREVLTHFTGPDSKYKDMFYGWDVVNEAISDGTNSYRSDAENPNESLSKDTHGSNSSWWHVYQSERFIIEAFRFANKYAPEDLDLYYNDYNDATLSKAFGIEKLLLAVKEAPGTRIDGMGMQGHYSSTAMNEKDFEICAKKYMDTGVKLMITEWDLTAADSYDPDDIDSRITEYTRQANRYLAIYKKLQSLQDSGYDIAGFTFWVTIDKLSWLQSRSDVGGGSKTGNSQCPLLFDDDYKAKPAYWAFVDADKITDLQKARKAEKKAEKEAAEGTSETSEVTASSESAETVTASTESPAENETEITAASTETNDDDKKINGKSRSSIIATAIIIGVIVLFGSLLSQRFRDKHPKKERKPKSKDEK